MVPFRTVAYGQQRLKASIARQPKRDERLEFGFLIHARRDHGRLALGIITLQAESIPLSPALLCALLAHPLYLSGQTRVELSSLGPCDRTDGSTPVDTIVMRVVPEPADEDPPETGEPRGAPITGIEALVSAEALLQPIVLLTNSRPTGWPS